MSYVAIPNEIFESAEYKSLSTGHREFLIRLYSLRGDCDTFTVNYLQPEEYGETDGRCMQVKLKSLLDAGFITVFEKAICDHRGPRPRILKFKHSALEAYQ